jgi:glycerol kinase
MQFQSDVSDVKVERPADLESTARGAAMLAGLGAGLFHTKDQAEQMISIQKTFQVGMSEKERASRLAQWHDAVRRARSDLGAS